MEMWIIVALTERYRKLQSRISDSSKPSLPVPVTSTIASLESLLNEAEDDSIAQLESVVRHRRVCVHCMHA